MSVDVKAETVIARPRQDVAKLMFDPRSETIWMQGLTKVFPQAIANGNIQSGTIIGKLNGVIPQATPNG